jgi:hypothetical protein
MDRRGELPMTRSGGASWEHRAGMGADQLTPMGTALAWVLMGCPWLTWRLAGGCGRTAVEAL